jgi:hypothetical protein
LLKESINAMKNRILEVHFIKRPNLPMDVFPEDGTTFSTRHLILGLFEKVLTILVNCPDPENYYSKMVINYVIAGLGNYCDKYCNYFNISGQNKTIIVDAIQTLKPI